MEHLAAELVGFVINDDEFVGEVLCENGLRNAHSTFPAPMG
ncbi:hypothetical protein A2U01_0071809, partial [Trifolium medium]|nr:hypothetical protein [Trifolium medium]